jgi:hypothetical protein
MLGMLSTVIRQEKEMKEIQIRKEKIKFSLFAHGLFMYLKDLLTLPEYF